MKSLENHLHHIGAAPFQVIWAKYFTMKCDLNNSGTTPVDQFLKSISYTPSDPSIIKSETQNCKSIPEITEKLAEIFNLKNFNIYFSAIIAKNAKSQKQQSIKSPNDGIIPQYIFRGFIATSYLLDQALDSQFDKNMKPIFDTNSWKIIHCTSEFLLLHSSTSGNFDVSDFVNSLDLVFESYSKHADKIVLLQEDDPVYTSLTDFMFIIISSISQHFMTSLNNVLIFLNSIFKSWLNNIEYLNPNTKLYEYYNGYVQILIYIVGNLNRNQKIGISYNISKFLSFYDPVGPDDILFSHGIDNLLLLSKIIDNLGDDSRSMACHGFFQFSIYSSSNYILKDNTFKETENKNESRNTEETLIYVNKPDEYFKTHQLVDMSLINCTFKKKFINRLKEIIQNLFTAASVNQILCHIHSNSKRLNNNQAQNFFLLIMAAVGPIQNFPDYGVSMIIESLIYKHLFETPTNSIHQKILDITFPFILNAVHNNTSVIEFLLKKISEICSINYEYISLFMPLFRSILNSDKCNVFVSELLKTDKIINLIQKYIKIGQYQQQIDELISFLQVASLVCPLEFFRSYSLPPILLEIVTCERYYRLIFPCYSYALNLSSTYGNQANEIISHIILTIPVIFTQINQETEINAEDTDKFQSNKKAMIKLSNDFVIVIRDSVSTFNRMLVMDLLKQKFFIALSSLPQATKDAMTLKNVILILSSIYLKHSKISTFFESNGSPVFSALKESFKFVPIDEELIELLLSFAMNKHVSLHFITMPMIQNRAPLKLLLDIATGTEYEEQIIDDLIVLCNGSTSNAFECFHINIIGYALNRAFDKKLQVKATTLFQSVASTFFSPLSLNDTFKILYSTSLEKRSACHQLILDCLLRLLIEDRPNPVNCYFHLNGLQTGIFGPSLQVSSKWYFITTLRLDISTTDRDPILALQDEDCSLLMFSFVNSELVFSREKNHKKHDVFFKNVKFLKHVWYQMLICYTPKLITLYVNGKIASTIKISNRDLNGKTIFRIGCCSSANFSGDFGPIAFYNNNLLNPKEIFAEYEKTITSHNRYNSDLYYDPCNVDENRINDVTIDGQSAQIVGRDVQFCMTLSSIAQYNGTFQRFLPMFSMINRPRIEEEEDIDDQMFHTLLVILRFLLAMSPDMEKMFESNGGFQLLTGIFNTIKTTSFSPSVPPDLLDIYNSLTLFSLKVQMVEYIWLNFDLWSRLTKQVQIRFYKYALFAAFTTDPKPFQIKTYDFLLYQIQSKIYLDEEPINQHISSTLFNALHNIFINRDDLIEIRTIQWDFFKEVFIPNQATIIFLFMILSYHQDLYQRKLASKVFDYLLDKGSKETFLALKALNGIDSFLPQLNLEYPQNSIYFIRKISVLQRESILEMNSYFDLQKAILTAIALINFEKVDSRDLFNECINHVFDEKGEKFNCPEFIPLLSIFSLYADHSEVEKVYTLFVKAISNDFEKFDLFVNDVDSWQFYLFIFSNSSGDMINLFNEYISRNPEKMNDLIYFVSYIQISKKINMFPLLSKLFNAFLQRVCENKPTYEIIHSVLFTYDISTNGLNEMKMFTKDEIIDLKESLENMTIPSIKINFNPLYDEILYISLCNVLLELMKKREKLMIEFSKDFSVNIFAIYSYLLSKLIINTKNIEYFKEFECRKNENQFLLSSNAIELSQTFMNIAAIEINYEPITSKIDKDDTISTFDSFVDKATLYAKNTNLQPFIQRLSAIASSMQEGKNFISKIDVLTNDQYINSFQNWEKMQQNSRVIVERYNMKLAQSFIRESTLNGGPLSTVPPEQVKWRWANRADSSFRPTFYRVNRYFDDHRKASANRDSMPYNDNSSEQNLTPFKRILDQNVSVVQTPQKHPIAISSFHVTQLTIANQFTGNLSVSEDRIFFEGYGVMDGFGGPVKEKQTKSKFIEVPYESLSFIFTRAHLYEDVACEIFTNINKSYLFVFDSKENRDEFLLFIRKEVDSKSPTDIFKKALFRKRSATIRQEKTNKFDLLAHCRRICSSHVQTISSIDLLVKSGLTEAWQDQIISNFEYLFSLNILSGRSLNDLSKYPVFPWIFSDYTSDAIDLNDPNVYRKLDTPLGAYEPTRLQLIHSFKEDFFDPTEYCLYRTHYSSAASVIGFLIRTEPFTSMHIILQNGRFDHADRLFSSVEKAWNSVSTQMNDFRELIPQFYCDPHFLKNECGFNFGKTMNDEIVSDVKLPNWSNGSAYKFIEIQRAGLESEYVSAHLNDWIDLIFGIYQKSLEKNNLFHMFSYPDCLQSPLIKDEKMRNMAKYHSANFGTCCDQIFTQKHPTRKSSNFIFRSILTDNKNTSENNISHTDNSNSYNNNNAVNNHYNVNNDFNDIPSLDLNQEICYFDNRCMLTSRGELIDFTKYNRSELILLDLKIREKKVYSSIEICKQYSLIFFMPRGGTFIRAVSYNKDGQTNDVKRISHESSSISCFEVFGNRYLLTGGYDCSIHVWSLPSLDLIARLSIQSLPVLSLSGCDDLDFVASIDENHQIWLSSIEQQRFIHTFKINCPFGSRHKLLTLKNGLIVVSSFSSSIGINFLHSNDEKVCKIDIFDTWGNFLKEIDISAAVVKLKAFYTKKSESFIVATLENSKVIIINTTDFVICKEFLEKVDPNFVCVDGNNREILCLCRKGKPHIKTYKV
ncbi:hypothetical protein TRFO_33768 [Tritrichomonas foetus]|uniref:Beige/BEACH domain containing protein n=1 Tax=Tritrichomonas foetus TaxID=1144522 RepID=A0A1J4JQE6_9EUKA|nr:hypothetical protein TRFO_33768 [Tritrichomonas foetus]|eukprot:OHS99739.1 hypothetical protein TRFO_33768 [Tritrichomonas foetus]